MSPNGLITLSVAARKALGMTKNESGQIRISTDENSILLLGSPVRGEKTYRVSKKGMTIFKGEERDLLLKNKNRHYWMEIDDAKKEVRLLPY